MSQQHSYLLVEGPQDVVFLGRLLQQLGLETVQQADQVPPKWEPLLDGFACQRDRALRAAGRGSIPFWQLFKPTCLVSESHVVVIEQVGGNRAKFGRTLQATNALIDGGLASFVGVGLLPDADTNSAASLTSAQEALRLAGLPVPSRSQEIVAGLPNAGVFVIPGGADCGGLEEILIDCGQTIYPDLIAGAKLFVAGVDHQNLFYTADDLREIKTPQGPAKAVVGSVASVLKPGSTIQVSVLRDRWVYEVTLAVPRVAALVHFLKTLCEIS